MSHRGPFPLKVTSTTTVARLKQLVEEKYKIPVGVQRWILGKKLATDDAATLTDHQVTTSGCPVFLYLVAPANGEQNHGLLKIPDFFEPTNHYTAMHWVNRNAAALLARFQQIQYDLFSKYDPGMTKR